MNQSNLIELFIKERDYELGIFGDYQNNPALNLASFITFLKIYLDKVEKSYAGVWSTKDEFPDWLKDTAESKVGQSAPVKAYENLIKLMALAGAALEAYVEVDIDLWRTQPITNSKKWINNKIEGEI